MAEMISEDVKNFIVLHNYGKNGKDWPRCTVVLSTVTITLKNKKTEQKKWIHRNEPRQTNEPCGRHAEICFLQALRETIGGRGEVNKVKAELVQNYSPCLDCAMEFLEFKNEIGRNVEVILTITFANFYKCHKEPDKTQNRSGLVKLLKNHVELEVFQGKRWEELLNETSVTDMNDLLQLAKSPERKNRENEDMRILKELKSKAEGK